MSNIEDLIKTVKTGLALASDGPIVDRDGLVRDAIAALDKIEAMVVEQKPVAWGLIDEGAERARGVATSQKEGWEPLYRIAPVAQQPQAPTESVLIDGIAYDIPAPVAAELLRLHIEARQPQAEASWLTDSKQTKERQFAEFLNDRRSMNVSAVFHEVLHKFAELAAPQQAEAVPNTLQKAEAHLLNLIGEYWALAYAEGEEGRNHDTEDGAAQRTHAAIAKAVKDLIAAASSTQQTEAVPQKFKETPPHIMEARGYVWIEPSEKTGWGGGWSLPTPHQAEAVPSDTERLDWMIFYSARLQHGNDGEYCCVVWIEDHEEHLTALFGSAREAIDAAIEQQKAGQ